MAFDSISFLEDVKVERAHGSTSRSAYGVVSLERGGRFLGEDQDSRLPFRGRCKEEKSV